MSVGWDPEVLTQIESYLLFHKILQAKVLATLTLLNTSTTGQISVEKLPRREPALERYKLHLFTLWKLAVWLNSVHVPVLAKGWLEGAKIGVPQGSGFQVIC